MTSATCPTMFPGLLRRFGKPLASVALLTACLLAQPVVAQTCVTQRRRQLCVARELTKKFEEFRRGTATELSVHYEAHPAKGEITLVIAPADR